MRKFDAYVANWNKLASGTAAAGSVAQGKFPSLVWTIAHLHLRS
jgi:hypothetical protein